MLLLAMLLAAPDTSLNLLCVGAGTAVKVRSDSAYAWANNGNNATISGSSTYDRDFSDTVSLEVNGESGRIRMPRSMLPKLRGGKDGWFDLDNVAVGDSEIRATAKVNVINHPKIVLDRIAGTISISGKSGYFSGHCRAFDPATEKRAF